MLTLNTTGLQVVRLQLQLRQLDYFKGHIDGYFDETVMQAVKAFQTANKLQSDGIVGPVTQNALNTATADGWHVLFLHCAATPEGRDDKADTLVLGHYLPAKLQNGNVIFNGKEMSAASVVGQKINLPSGTVYTITGREIYGGRGWSKPGYSDIIELSGRLVNVWSWDSDNQIKEWEQTWGVHGSTLLNRNARHLCYIGGTEADNINIQKDTRTPGQLAAMEISIKFCLLRNPKLIIAGHNQVQQKGCPSFDVPVYLRSIGIPEWNIAQWGRGFAI